jgi:hypothetical protein
MSYFANHGFIDLTGSNGIASLVEHITRIIAGCAEKQMIRIAAWWIITGMTDEETLGDIAMNDHPSEAITVVSVVPILENAVAAYIAAGSPQPARAGFVNFRPKAIDVFLWYTRHVVSSLLAIGHAHGC